MRTQLKPYLRKGAFKAWSDKDIEPGSEWFAKIKTQLAEASVAVLLVSPDFLASDFIDTYELGPVLKEAESGGVKILWVLIRDCAYNETRLKDYQAVVSPPGVPFAAMKPAKRDTAWRKVCEAIKRAVSRPVDGASDGAGPMPVPEREIKAPTRKRREQPDSDEADDTVVVKSTRTAVIEQRPSKVAFPVYGRVLSALLVLIVLFTAAVLYWRGGLKPAVKPFGQVRSDVLSAYTDQIVDNLIRASKAMPIIPFDFDESDGRLTKRVRDGRDYGAYLRYLSVPGSFKASDVKPAPDTAHILKYEGSQYYWVPIERRYDFLRLFLFMIVEEGQTPGSPANFENRVVSARYDSGSISPALCRFVVDFSEPMPSGTGTMDATIENKLYKFTLLPHEIDNDPKAPAPTSSSENMRFQPENRVTRFLVEYEPARIPVTPDEFPRAMANQTVHVEIPFLEQGGATSEGVIAKNGEKAEALGGAGPTEDGSGQFSVKPFGQGASDLLAAYTDQILDNLVRADGAMPFIQFEVEGSKRDRAKLVRDERVYDAYLQYLTDPDAFRVTDQEPAQQDVHVMKHQDNLYFWIPKTHKYNFLRLYMVTTVEKGQPFEIPDKFKNVVISTILEKASKSPPLYRFVIDFGHPMPNGPGRMDATINGKTYTFPLHVYDGADGPNPIRRAEDAPVPPGKNTKRFLVFFDPAVVPLTEDEFRTALANLPVKVALEFAKPTVPTTEELIRELDGETQLIRFNQIQGQHL